MNGAVPLTLFLDIPSIDSSWFWTIVESNCICRVSKIICID